MKKLISLALSLVLVASFAVFTASAEDEKDYGFVKLVVEEGACELVDNSATNHQASDFPLCFEPAYGTGRTTQGDAVKFSDVTFDKTVTTLSVKCGYNLSRAPGTATQFWVYLNKIEGEPIAKLEVSDSETASSKIIDQVHKYADVNIEPGTYTIIVVGETEYSGSFSEVNFGYEGVDLEAAMAQKVADDEAALEAERKAREEELERRKAEEEAKANGEANADADANVDADAPAENAGVSPIVWAIIAIVVVAGVVVAVVASKKKKNA